MYKGDFLHSDQFLNLAMKRHFSTLVEDACTLDAACTQRQQSVWKC